VLLLGVVAGLIYAVWSYLDGRAELKATEQVEDFAALGDVVPQSLHPVIDPWKCMGSGACVRGCPEHYSPLGMVQGRARLVNPLGCIGHGACEAACPAGAISLVYGTKHRGVELPRIDPNFQTSRAGVYIAGELGGMGLIRNAVSQGAQAADHIIKGSPEQPLRRGVNGAFDAVVVGAGPAGISATLRLLEAKLSVVLLDAETLGGTIMHYPRAKVVMTGDLNLPLVGRVKRRTMSKEALVDLWSEIQEKFNPPFFSGQLVRELHACSDGMWDVKTESQNFRAANVVLAIGVRGSPRKLGVPGEELAKVAYRLIEPQEFASKHALVVGGGNSAVESALALADAGGCASVSISYRREQFARCRAENRRRIDEVIQAGQVTPLLPSEVVRIDPDRVTLKHAGGEHSLRNDAVIVQIGGSPPADLLKSFGIDLVTKYGER
jgi:thioredoxin reductase (NADPH)